MAPPKHPRQLEKQKKHRTDASTNGRITGINDGPHRYPSPSSKAIKRIAISQMPVETMVQIFKFALREEGSSSWRISNRRRIGLTHVCKYWRGVAIGAQVLWVDIEIKQCIKSELIAEYLKRSGTSRIMIRYDGEDDNDSDATLKCLYLTLGHLPRIRELHMQGLQTVPKKMLRVLLKTPAPEMENFTFAANSMELFDIGALFNGQAPKLTGLFVSAILPESLQWGRASFMRHLEHVCVDRSPLALQDVFSILSRSSELKRFSVRSIANGSSLPSQHPIQMPFLSNLDIQNAGYETLSYLFQKVAFPKLKSWNIVCNDNPLQHRLTNPRSVMPCIFERITDLYLYVKISGKLVSVNASSSRDHSADHVASQKMTYLWRTEIPIVGCFIFLCLVIRGTPWCSASALLVDIEARTSDAVDLEQDEQITERHWRSLLRLFPDLRQLTVQYTTGLKANFCEADIIWTESHYGVLAALKCTRKAISKPEGAKHRDMPVICSKLSELRLRGFDLRNDDFVLHLVKAVRSRSRLGKRLAKLYMTDAYDWDDANLSDIYECGAVDYIEIKDKNGKYVEVGTPSPFDQDFDYDYNVECGWEDDEDVYDYWD